jgi:hypothetical protein
MRTKQKSFLEQEIIITHMSYLERFLIENFLLKQIKARLFQKCNDAHECMLVLNFKI